MQIIITDAWMAKSRAIHLTGARLLLALMFASFALMLVAALLYHWVFLKGARDGWPVVGSLVRLVVKDEFDQRDRFMRENLDVLARKLGELQAKLTQLESLGERISGLAGMNPAESRLKAGQGGALVPGKPLSAQDIESAMAALLQQTGQRTDWMTVMESRLLDQKLRGMLHPTQEPVTGGNLGSGFGWRIDPFTGTSALHAGLDYPAEVGTPIHAAAGGVVVAQEFNAPYGNMIEIDHGNNLVTRYAHAAKVFIKQGDLVRNGQIIAQVGNTGRSTGPHLHFEVLVQGIPQDPLKFLAAGKNNAAKLAAGRGSAKTAPGPVVPAGPAQTPSGQR